jgi:hypothetical protein
MKTIRELVDQWPNGDGPILLVRKLRSSALPLTNKQIFVVLEAIESTCPHCWDTDTSGTAQCTCRRDE